MNGPMPRQIYPCLWQHPNQTWYILYDRKNRKSLRTRNKAEARALFPELVKDHRRQKLILLQTDCPPKTLVDFWEEYEEHRFKTVRPMTCQTDKQAFRVFRQALGDDTQLFRITRHQVEKTLAALGQKVSRTSANTWFRHFKAALNTAKAWGYLIINPCQGIKQLKTRIDFPRYLTREEVSHLLATEPDPEFRLLWHFLIAAGCRRAEALAITVRNVDCAQGRIYVGETKNGRAKYIIFNPDVAAVLWEILPDVGSLWTWNPDSVTHHFERTARTAGLDCRLHDLRHTYGSWLAMAGVKLQVIKDLMGHQDIKTTLIYSHLSQEHLEEAARKIKL